MKEKVFILDPTGSKWAIPFTLGSSRFDPIAIGYLGAYLKSKGMDVEIFEQRDESDDFVVEKILAEDPDILAVSTMTYNFDKARKIAGEVKAKSHGVKTVFGGYHVTAESSIDLPEIDFSVRGEGEHALLEIVEAIRGKGDFRDIEGISFKEGKGVVHTKLRPRIKDLDSLPFPMRYKPEDCRMGHPMIPRPADQTAFVQLTYSRGCIHDCTFCTSPMMWGREVVYRSAENVVDEIEFLMEEFGVNGFFLTDLTFNASAKKVKDFCQEIISRGIEINWSAGCRVTNNEELLKLMKEAGCTRLAYGVESLEDHVLSSIHKGQTFSDAKECLEMTNNLGIFTRAYLMMGYFSESRESLQRMEEKIVELPADQLRLSVFTPFPGTALYEKVRDQGLLLTTDFSEFTSEVPVLKTGLSVEELISAKKKIEQTFYSSEEYRRRLQQKVERFPHLKRSYEDFFSQLSKQ